ncbi:MAG: hypothetical protein NY202_02905 [Mollicutes bacterium UO1]
MNRLVAHCPCNICSFNTRTNTQTPQNLMNSLEPITICFCVLPNFNISGKLNRDIFDYQRDEPTRSYKSLVSERTILKDLVCGQCKRPDISHTYYQVELYDGVATLCEACKRETKGGIVVGKI